MRLNAGRDLLVGHALGLQWSTVLLPVLLRFATRQRSHTTTSRRIIVLAHLKNLGHLQDRGS
jgi:hypothetical protein